MNCRTYFGILMMALCLCGCANEQITQSGYLTDYAALKVEDGQTNRRVRRPDAASLAKYTSIVIEPVENRLSGNITPAEALDLTRTVEKQLRIEIGKEWQIVDKPGPHTLMLRSALTQVKKSNPAANVVLTVVAVPLFNGGLSGEAEFIDPAAKSQIGAIQWADEGRLNPVGYYSELGHPKQLAEEFAKAVAMILARK